MEQARPRKIAEMLAAAREHITRYSPEAAFAASRSGAVLIDTRSSGDVDREGSIPGSVYIHRNVLEWRCDASSGHSDPRIDNPDRPVIVVCNDGYSSSLAAASLVELGFRHAGDLEGGFRAWARAGLPVERKL